MSFRLKYEGNEINERLDKAGTALQEHQDISHLATKDELSDGLNKKQDIIEDLESIRENASKGATALQSVPSEYVTEEELEGKGYLTEHQSLSHLATKSELKNKVDKVDGKQLSTEDFTSALKTKLEGLSNYDDTELSDALSTLRGDFDKLVSGDTTTAIKSFNEVIAFLDGIQDTEDLSGIIASIEQQIAGKQDVIEGLDDINEKLEVINNIVDEDGYLYSNGEKVDMRIARSLLPIGTEVPKNANLNSIDYVRVGKYYCHLNVNAETITNCPVSVAFMMDVFNPLSTLLDDETTKAYTYRVRLLTRYDTGQQYIQSCQTTGTAGNWRYNSWYAMPVAPLSKKSPQIGSGTQGVYINSSGIVTKMTYTLGKSVPSNAVFTDTNTKVTAVGNHYTPAENTTSQIDAPDGEVVTGIKRDAAGHVVGVVTTPQSGGSGGGIAVETDPIFSASPAASITEVKITEWDGKQDVIDDLEAIRNGAAKGATSVHAVDTGDILDEVNVDYATTAALDTKVDKVAGELESKLATKQDTINDLDTIRSGAALGATALQKETYIGTYSKPSGGIPKSDLASAVQTSLDRADTALQSYTEQYKGTVTGIKINGATKSPASGVVDLGTVITDVSDKADKSIVGAFYKADWEASEAVGISKRLTGILTLPAGTYVVNMVCPYCSDMNMEICIGFSAKMAIGSGNTFVKACYGTVTMLASFTTTTNLSVLTAASTTNVSWSYLDRGGLSAIRIG